MQQDSFVQTIFDEEEMQNILKLLSIQLGLGAHFGIKDLGAFLSIMYSVLVVDDEPQRKQESSEFTAINEDNFKNVG